MSQLLSFSEIHLILLTKAFVSAPGEPLGRIVYGLLFLCDQMNIMLQKPLPI